ncbi:MAG: hypothetical protein JOZ08_10710 [Verrucomicrobia bacterium]|nr:hypothetical protein [Verrucomicrobiota bacterium]MBV8274937.1 hypothetical protein [Verrucomicrobiota bacterium]
MKNSRKNNQSIINRPGSEKPGLGKALSEFWQDLQSEPEWRYERLSPAQLLKELKLHYDSKDYHELVRASWFWSRRPRFLGAASFILWLAVALGLPFWLFVVPSIGVPLIIVTALIINTEIVRSIRWRRQYEFGIDRLIRTVPVQDSDGASRSNP